MLDLLLIDMAGVMDERFTPAVVDIVRVRLGLPRQVGIDVMGEEFFTRTAPGRVAPVELEEALNEMEENIWEDWQPGEIEPTNFLLCLLIDRRTPRDFLLQVLEELMQRTAESPAVVALQVRRRGNPQVSPIDRADLPLRWRCLAGDTVVLNSDVWLEGEWEAAGAAPAIPRGTVLTIVERAVFDGTQVNRECLLAVTTPEGQVDPLTVALPWQFVTHPSEWGSDPAPPENGRAVASFRLPCWFSVRVEMHDSAPAATSAESGRRA